ncbi:MAG: GNAT family N-acetyltransferase [Bacteroidales bacterium]|nr:GNAT family N-acetyltransferase [Bacteroidales bacterium]
MELRQWYFGDEKSLINLYDNFDRSCCEYAYPEPGMCDESRANFMIRHYVDMGYDGDGYARAIVVDGKVVGHIEYRKRFDIYNADCDVEIILLPEVCGRGVGSEAVRRMMENAFCMHNYECMYATMLDTNISARRMVEKAGMKYCGIDDSGECIFQGKPCTRVVYGIRRQRKEIKNAGVELKQWEACDIDALAKIFETVDGRFDDIPNPILRSRRARSIEEIESWDEKKRQIQMLYCMREYVDLWNVLERQDDDIYRAIVNNGEIVGLISVSMQNGNRSIDGLLGYMIMQEFCGRGIATKAVKLMLDEAFSQRNLHRISAWVYKPNEASSRVLEKNGFCLEGIQKDAILCEGNPTDHLLYGLLRSDFFNFNN